MLYLIYDIKETLDRDIERWNFFILPCKTVMKNFLRVLPPNRGKILIGIDIVTSKAQQSSKVSDVVRLKGNSQIMKEDFRVIFFIRGHFLCPHQT